MKMTPLSLGNIILLKEKGGMREFPGRLIRSLGVPEEEKGAWGSQGGDRGLEFSRRKKGQISFFLYLP